jgi:ParB family chromosome partitioning protein
VAKSHGGLGRGLGALLGDYPEGQGAPGAENGSPEGVTTVAPDRIDPNPEQPRSHFDPDELDELAASIAKNGLLQPIVVRQVGSRYQIIAGERRWQACKRAGLDKVPVRVIDADDDKVIELAMIENIQRSDLNPIEEAHGYRLLMEREHLTQAQLAELLSKGRSTIANALRLLDLPLRAQQLLLDGTIAAGHARAILSIPTEAGKKQLTERLAQGNMTVRAAEDMARRLSQPTDGEKSDPQPSAAATYRSAAKHLSDQLNTDVRVSSAKGKHWLKIKFDDADQLETLVKRIAQADEDAR